MKQKKSKHIKIIVGIISAFAFTFCLNSCGINSSLMFKTPRHFKYDSIPMSPEYEYRISPDDRLELELYTNNGAKLVDFVSGGNTEGALSSGNASLDYLVRKDGFVNLPVVGDVKVQGLSIRECQDTLEQVFSNFYHEPFVQVKVSNQRVIVFPGSGADAKVVPLMNNNTTLMEALALAGGIADRGKSKNVKIMRNVNGKREVYLIDLSTIEGLSYTDMIVQANDYIYIEPQPQVGKEIMKDLVPIVSLISSAAVIVTVYLKLK